VHYIGAIGTDSDSVNMAHSALYRAYGMIVHYIGARERIRPCKYGIVHCIGARERFRQCKYGT